jgi:hypothetical protein
MGNYTTTVAGGLSSTSGAIHIRGSRDLPTFLNAVRRRYGEQYTKTFTEFANKLFKAAGNPQDLALLMTEEGGILAGLADTPARYYPIPAQRRGVMQYGTSLSGVRTIIPEIGATAESVSQRYMTNFFEDFTKGPHGARDLGTALEAGHLGARRQAFVPSVGGQKSIPWSGIKDPTISRGQRSFYRAIFDFRTSARVGGQPIGPFHEAIFQAAGDLSGAKQRTGLAGRLQDHAIRGVEGIGDYSLTPDIAGDPGAFFGIKAKDTAAGGVIPLTGKEGMRSHMLYGLITPGGREYTKGLYHLRGKLEIITKPQLRNIAGSLTSAGYQGRTSTIGTTLGEIGVVHGLRGQWSRHLGRPVTPTVTQPMFLGVLAGKGAQNLGIEQIMGDAGALRTARGAQLVRGRQPTVTRELRVGLDEAQELVRRMSGGVTGGMWDAFSSNLENLGADPRFAGEGGARLSPEFIKRGVLPGGASLPRGAAVLTGLEYSTFSEQLKLSFATDMASDASTSALFAGTRFTGRAVSAANISGYGGIGQAAHFITSEANLASMNAGQVAYEHMTGLLGTQKGMGYSTPVRGAGGRFAGGKVSGIDAFMYEYGKAGGTGLATIGKGAEQRIYDAGTFDKAGLRHMETALGKMGFTSRQISGYAYESGGVAGVLSLFPGMSQQTGTIGKYLQADKLKLLISSLSHRFGESEDVLNQSKAFSVRLETLNRAAQGMVQQYKSVGLKNPWQHPMMRQKIEFLEAERGIKLPRTMTQITPLDIIPEEFKAPFRPLMKGFKESEHTVLSLEDARAKYIRSEAGINVKMFNRPGLDIEDLRQTELMRPGREGFYIKLPGTPQPIPERAGVTLGAANEPMHMARHVYIPATSTIERLTGNMTPRKGDFLWSTVALMEGERATDISTRAAFQGIWRGLARYGGKEGFLAEHVFRTGKMPGGYRARLVPKALDVDAAFKPGIKGISKDVFNVGMSKTSIHGMIDEMAGGDKALKKELKKRLNEGRLYGTIEPTPTHGSGHVITVKYDIDTTLKMEAAGKRHLAVHPWLAAHLNRDFDKDVIEGGLIGRMKLSDIDPEQFIRQQMKNLGPSFDVWQNILATAKGGPSAPLGKAAAAFAYYGFGALPSLAWMGFYGAEAFGGAVTAPLAPKKIAEALNRVSGRNLHRDFTAEHITKYAKMIGGAAGVGNAEMLQRNIFQAAIQKGGRNFEDLMERFLTIPTKIVDEYYNKELTPDVMQKALSMATDDATAFLRTVVGSGEVLDKLKVDIAYSETGDALIKRLGRELGHFHGTTALVMASHFKSKDYQHGVPNLIRGMLGSEGKLSKIIKGIFGEDVRATVTQGGMGDDLYHSLTKSEWDTFSQAGPTASNRAQHAKAATAGSEVLGDSVRWMERNWKLVVGAGAALLGLRVLGQMTAGDELAPPEVATGPLYGPAPLPKAPMVNMETPREYNPVFSSTPSAAIMPSNGYMTSAYAGGTMGSENINNHIDSISLNRGSMAGSYTNINVKDTREYRSNWEMQRVAQAARGGDFIHPWQYNG